MSVLPNVEKRALVVERHDDTQAMDVRVEGLQKEISNLEERLTELEAKSARSSPMIRTFGRQFGFGVAGKIDWVRFKLGYLKEELARFESAKPA